MMKLISTLSVYLRYSACLLVFVALTACGDDEAVTGETSSTSPSSSTNPSSSGEPSSTNPSSSGESSSTNPSSSGEPSSTNPSSSGEPSSTTGALAAPGSNCSCDDDCVSVEGHTGVCYRGMCMVDSDPVDTCDEEGTTANCPTGFKCWGEHCWPGCDEFRCENGICDAAEGASCIPDGECDSSCSRHC